MQLIHSHIKNQWDIPPHLNYATHLMSAIDEAIGLGGEDQPKIKHGE